LLLTAGIVMSMLTAPAPDLRGGIDAARELLGAKRYAGALDVLNAQVLPHVNSAALTPDDKRDFYLLRARSLFLGQRELGIDRAENNRAIVTEFTQAERLNATLDERDTEMLALALLSLDEVDDAVRRALALPDSAKAARTELLRSAIQHRLTAQEPDHAGALDLIAFLTSDPHQSADDRAWCLARQAEVLVGQRLAEEAAARVLRTLPRLDGADPAILGEVRYHLARAYMAQNALEDTAKELARAQALLGSNHQLAAPITLLQAEVFHRKPILGSARERYTTVVSRYPFSDEFAAALLGLAEVEAESVHQDIPLQDGPEPAAGGDAAGAVERSLEHFARLVELFQSGKAGALTRDRVGASLLTRFREQFDAKKPDFRRALQFADLGVQLFGIDQAPAELVLATAQVHRKMAEELLSAAGAGGVLTLADADPATQREAREHLIRAGDAFRVHASKVVQIDSGTYGESLWAAADAFDRAGDTDASISAFQQFVGDFPSDLRQPEARFRLAQAYQARGDLELAAAAYRELLAGRDGGGRAGPFADASYVPLAQTLLADGEPRNDEEAENLLLTVVTGSVGGTQTRQFRDALRELGQRYYATGRYERAIERFQEYLERTPSAGPTVSPSELDAVRYKLADSCRLSAASIGSALAGGAMPEGERRDLERTRTQRLSAAGELYDQVRRSLEVRDRRTALEELYLRNTYFYMGDCAFDLRDFPSSITLYDAARERYPREPASLVAMAQIVSALLAMGDIEKAKVANIRAQRFYESIPPQAWEDPNLPMSQQDWKRWLDSQEELRRAERPEGTAVSTGSE
jgi:TolA-binding protein